MPSIGEYGFELDGTDMSTTPYNIYVVDGEPPLVPEPRIFEKRKATTNGSVIQGASYEAARFTLSCACIYSDASNPDTTLDAIAGKLLAATVAAKTFRIGIRQSKQYTVRVTSAFEPDRRGNGALFSISFIAPNPIPTTV